MYKKLLLLLLLLTIPMLRIPMTASASSPTLTSSDSTSPNIESQLKLAIEQYKSASSFASDKGGVSTILQFSGELSGADIELAEQEGISFDRRDGSIVHVGSIYAATVSSVSSLEGLGSIGLVQASSGSKQFYPSLASSVAAIGASDVWTNMEVNGTPIDGTGTTVAVIDTGATWLHPSLWRASTGPLNILSNGSKYYVDLNNNSQIDPGEGPISTVYHQTGSEFDYSEDYMFIDTNDNGIFQYSLGDRWLGGIDRNHDGFISLGSEKVVVLGEPKVAILYDQYTSQVYVRGVNLTEAISDGDTIGHGTHVASIIAGGQIGMTDYVGVAPGADLIIIKSPLDSESILDGISFAAEHGAKVINMSFSSYLGFLDGTDDEDVAISEAFLKYGITTALAAGNLGNQPKHARFTVASGTQTNTTLYVINPPDYSFLSLLWRSDNNDEHIILSAPGHGDVIDLGAFSDIVGNPFEISGDNISAYVFADTSIKGTNRVIVQVSAPEHFWDSGTWKITFTNPSGAAITVDGYAWDNSWTGGALRFTSNIDYTHTISSPGTSDMGVTVSSWNEVNNDISYSSSTGPRIDGVAKPNVAAPGDSIRAAFNSLSNLWASRSGTSMAAPHVAGALALIAQVAKNQWATFTSLEQGSGGYSHHYNTPSSSWGYGLVDPLWSIQNLLVPSGSEIYWGGVPYLATDTVDPSVDPGLDILNVSVYQTNSSEWFRVGFLGAANFMSDNCFTIDWDTDSSMSTGQSGIDLRVNVTGGAATVYNWTGSGFTQVGAGGLSNVSDYLYVGFGHYHGAELGRIQFSSGNAANASQDEISAVALADEWGPLIEDVSITSEGMAYTVRMKVSDKDTDLSLISLDAKVIDGGLSVFDSAEEDSSYALEASFDLSQFNSTNILSMVLHASDGSMDVSLPPIMLAGESSLQMEFTNMELDQTVVRVGPLISDRITGRFDLQGYLLASEVGVSLRPPSGLSYNITLTGSSGHYEFDISPAGFTPGIYDVYAVAVSQGGQVTSKLLGRVDVVQDYSYVLLIWGVGVVVIVAATYLKKVRNRKGVSG